MDDVKMPPNPKRCEKGAVALEFALILPTLLILVMGIIEFGRAYNTVISLNGAAREGARVLALCGTSSPCEGVVEAVENSAVLDLADDAVSEEPCASAGDPASVLVDKDFDSLIPYLPFSITLTGKGTMRCGL
ncbi:MAG: TadE/TadG family type IV pilus assembly protein [Burkholderiaceae bacterium]